MKGMAWCWYYPSRVYICLIALLDSTGGCSYHIWPSSEWPCYPRGSWVPPSSQVVQFGGCNQSTGLHGCFGHCCFILIQTVCVPVIGLIELMYQVYHWSELGSVSVLDLSDRNAVSSTEGCSHSIDPCDHHHRSGCPWRVAYDDRYRPIVEYEKAISESSMLPILWPIVWLMHV